VTKWLETSLDPDSIFPSKRRPFFTNRPMIKDVQDEQKRFQTILLASPSIRTFCACRQNLAAHASAQPMLLFQAARLANLMTSNRSHSL
jgi:hypothetical protein